MTHNITINRKASDLVEAYNDRHQSWLVPAPTDAEVGDQVMLTSSDGVDFLCWVSGMHSTGDMTIRVSG